MMFELFGVTYALSKEVADSINWKDEEERVVANFPEKFGLKERAGEEGIRFLWSFPEQLESHLKAGYEIFYEIDESRGARRRFVLKDGSILIGKRSR